MRKVLVTGGSGKLGRFVCAELASHIELTVLDRVPCAGESRQVIADVRDRPALEGAMRGQDAVVHLAGVPNPRHPSARETFETNVVGTWSVLDTALASGVQRVVLCSSDCVTGLLQQSVPATPLYLPVDEAHPALTAEPYGLSKHLAEQTALAFGRRGLEVVVLRPALIVFPGMESSVIARGADLADPNLWWYASAADVARAFRLALDVPEARGRTFFIGASNTFSLTATLELVERRYGRIPPVRKPQWYRDDPHAALFDTTLAREVLGFGARDDWRTFAAHGQSA